MRGFISKLRFTQCNNSNCDLEGACFDNAVLDYAAVTNNIEDGTSWVNVNGRCDTSQIAS